jgi:predicted transposase YdaD
MPDFDNAWKEAIEALFEPFMAFFFEEAHREIDWARGFETLDKELQQIAPESEQGLRIADKLVKVWRTNGQDEWVLVHVEVQSQLERQFAERMFVYNYRLFDRYNRTVASFAILGDNRSGWRPDRFGYELWGTKVGIQFSTAKLLDYAADEAALESNPNPFAVVVLAHLKTLETVHDDEMRRISEVRLVKGLYQRGFSAEQIRQLYRLIDGMMSLPRPLAELVYQEIYDFEKERNMPFISTAERIGLEKGLAEGLARGREEGLLAGIEVALRIKFGQSGLALLSEIRQIDDVASLQTILDAVPQADSSDALRRLWVKP